MNASIRQKPHLSTTHDRGKVLCMGSAVSQTGRSRTEERDPARCRLCLCSRSIDFKEARAMERAQRVGLISCLSGLTVRHGELVKWHNGYRTFWRVQGSEDAEMSRWWQGSTLLLKHPCREVIGVRNSPIVLVWRNVRSALRRVI
ncbi:hypothetical protein DENSPDRAFT_514406 [Dentipellis sp. KUC8613]|nr:hypothetical protein DENSPDRAFT_514406 [Dentipellis sp. KUC8613]